MHPGTNHGISGQTVAVGSKSGVVEVTEQTHTKTVFKIGSGSGKQDVSLTVGGQTSNAVTFTYEGSELTSYNSAAGFPTGGAVTLTVVGVGFGDGTETVEVKIAGRTCTYISHTSTQILCTLPEGYGDDKRLFVSIDGSSTSPTWLPFVYDGPVVSNVNPNTDDTPGTWKYIRL